MGDGGKVIVSRIHNSPVQFFSFFQHLVREDAQKIQFLMEIIHLGGQGVRVDLTFLSHPFSKWM